LIDDSENLAHGNSDYLEGWGKSERRLTLCRTREYVENFLRFSRLDVSTSVVGLRDDFQEEESQPAVDDGGNVGYEIDLKFNSSDCSTWNISGTAAFVLSISSRRHHLAIVPRGTIACSFRLGEGLRRPELFHVEHFS
jgi:hypothetical protein